MKWLKAFELALCATWPRILALRDVRDLPCPECGETGCDQKVFLQKCHPEGGLVGFSKNGNVYLACRECGRPVVALKLAEAVTV